MSKVVSDTEARVNFAQIMDELVVDDEPIIVEGQDENKIVMISIAHYEQLLFNNRANAMGYYSADADFDFGAKLDEIHALSAADPLAKQNKTVLPDPVEVIQEMREERDIQLEEAIGLR